MGGYDHDGDWLKSELSKVLGWEDSVVDVVVTAIDTADGRGDVDEIITNYMDDNTTARSLVYKFLDHKAQIVRSAACSNPSTSALLCTSTRQSSDTAPSDRKRGNRDVPRNPDGIAVGQYSQRSESGLHEYPQTSELMNNGRLGNMKGTQRIQQLPKEKRMGEQLRQSGPSVSAGIRAPAAQLDKLSGARGKHVKGGQCGIQIPLAMDLKRHVVNCLKCGKIYDCRKVTENIIRFLESGGICAFCKSKVLLTYNSEKPALAQQKAESRGGKEKGDSPLSSMVAGTIQNATNTIDRAPESQLEEATAKAVEFKNRLVDFDKNAAVRTTVIDDQSDFFELDSNVWLSPQERKELRHRLEEERRLEESRKRNVHYTIDIVGRKWLVQDESKISEDYRGNAEAAARAAEATLKELPQGGGAAASAAIDTMVRANGISNGVPAATDGIQAFRELRAVPSPNIAVPAPIFLPQHKNGHKTSEIGADKKAKPSQGGWRSLGIGRLQHDDIFAGLEEETTVKVLYESLADVPELQAPEPAFDLCPAKGKDIQREVICPASVAQHVSINGKLNRVLMPSSQKEASPFSGPPPTHLPNDCLPDGMVLLKNWLDVDTQVRIVEELCRFGKGEGGFYTPTYSSGSELHMRQMCLGKHWDLRNREYSDVRSNYDGARPPPIPEWLSNLVQQFLIRASQDVQHPFPRMEPNVLIVNFYEKNGYLGLHQDKEEGKQSCQRGVPVVSFSIGASAEFVFNQFQSMEGASYVELESGDALVFGGASRMIYHGIRKVYPEKTCRDVVARTGFRKGRLNLTFRMYIPD